MSVIINSILFTDDYTGVPSGRGSDTGVPFLMGEVQDSMYATINFDVFWGTIDKSIVFSGTTATRSDIGGSFIADGFTVGDIANITGTTSNNGLTFVTAVTDTILTCSAAFTSETDADTNIYGQTPIKGLDFYFNLVINNSGEQFNSLTDIVQQKYSLNWSSNPSNTTIPPVGSSIAWWDGGDCKLTYNGISDAGQSFTLIQPFTIKPTWLANQLSNFQNKVPPSEFLNTCLKYIFQIDARYSLNPTVNHTSGPQTDQTGNTGWYNEFLNGGAATSVFQSVNYTNHATSAQLNAVDYNNDTDVVITLNGNFSASDPIKTYFSWLPQNPGAYQNEDLSYPECLLQDSCFQTIGGGAVNGANYGTAYQAIKNLTITLVSATQITVQFTISLGSQTKATLAGAGSNTWYSLVVTPQAGSVTTLLGTNRTAVLCDVNQATTDTDDPTLSTIITDGTPDIHFYKYPNTSTPYTDIKDFECAYEYAKMQFTVNENCILKSVGVFIVARNNSAGDFDISYSNDFSTGANANVEAEFILESWIKQTGGTFNGVFSNVSINETRGWDVEGLFNERNLNYEASLNDTGVYGYQLDYGFQIDYRYWLALQFYSVNFQPLHGKYLATYSNNSNWSLKFKVVWVVTNPSGTDTVFIRYCDIQAADKTNNGSNSFSITTSDNKGDKNFNGQIFYDIQTMVEVDFFGDFSYFPSGMTAFTGQIWFWFDNGIKQYLDMNSTEETPSGNSFWVGSPTLTKVDNGKVKVTGILSLNNKIRNYKLFARLGYKP